MAFDTLAYVVGGNRDTNASARSLAEVLENAAREYPERGIVHVAPSGEESLQTYAALLGEARSVARVLEKRGLSPGDALILVIEDSRIFLTLFWGCLFAKVAPVPLASPRGTRGSADTESMEAQKIIQVESILQAPIVRTSEAQDIFREAMLSDDRNFESPSIARDDLAVIQFSSGTTESPKGVLLTHGNLLSNIRADGLAVGLGDEDCVVSWLPYFHDFGLFGCHLAPLYAGARQVKIDPQHFARRPLIWMEKIAEHGGTVTSSTNTGLEHLLKVLEKRPSALDLSSLRVISLGAEMISVAACHRLADALGVARTIFVPGYGLTETTMAVTAHALGEELIVHRVDRAKMVGEGVIEYRDARGEDVAELTSVGRAVADCEVRITDAGGLPLPANRLGAIEIRGANVFFAYRQSTGVVPYAFKDGAWFDSGDIGFLDDEGRLTITGRAKEMLLFNGQNHCPHDVEQIARGADPDQKIRLVIIAGAYDPRAQREKALLFYVAKGSVEPVLVAMSARVNELAGFPIDHFIPLTQAEVPRTSSGKVMRRVLAEQFLRGAFDGAFDNEATVREIWAETLGIPAARISAGSRFFELGGDSLKAMRIQGRLEERFGVKLEAGFNYRYPTIAEQTRALEARDAKLDPPNNEFEVILRSLFADCAGLKKEEIGLNDPLVSKARKLTDVFRFVEEIKRVFDQPSLPPEFLEYSTLREMAGYLWRELIGVHSAEPFSLSNFQETLYFHRKGFVRNEPTGLSCFIFINYLLEGRLDVALLEQAFAITIERHPILRAVVDEAKERPHLRVLDAVSRFEVELHDLSALSAAEQRAALLEEGRKHNDHRFELERWPMFFAHVYRLAPEVHAFQFNIDHLLVDGFSFMRLLEEIFELHDRLLAGLPIPSRPAGLELRDYVLIESIRQRTPEYRRAMEFQLRIFESPPPKAALPFIADPANLGEVFFETHYQEPPAALFAALSKLGAAHKVSLNSILLAAYFKLMNIWSRQDDLIINMPVFNREQYFAGAREVLGSFIDIFPVRMQTGFEEPLLDLAVKIETFTRELLRTPVSSIELSRLIAERDGVTAASLSSIIFSNSIGVYSGEAAKRMGHVKMSKPEFRTGAPGTYLDFVLYDCDGEYHFNWNYVRNLIDGSFIEVLAGQYLKLLEQLAEGRPFTARELMPERHARILAELNRTEKDTPNTTLHAWIAAQARRTPNALALSFEDQNLTHAELDARANQVARMLRDHGLKRGEKVALIMNRSAEMIIAQLGVLKAGGAYVPIDPEYPPERIAYVLEDCGARVLFTQPEHLSKRSGARLITVVAGDAESYPALPVADQADPDDLAYMIYTSGSTGKPKGVMIRHRNIINWLHWVIDAQAIDPSERFAFVTSYAFDMTLTSNWVPFMTGASLHILGDKETRDVEALLAFIAEKQISFLNVTPSHFSLLAHARAYVFQAPLDLPKNMRIMLGGETISAKDLNLWLEHYPEHRFINEYGPTETSVASTYFPIPVSARGRVELDLIPIGKPIHNTAVYILDVHGNMCMPGVSGELCIGGKGVAVGYHRKPERSAKSFVLDPFAADGSLMYRTGDQARFLDDGNIEFLGRNDHQINLRGYRIEAGEVETALREFPGIAEVVVTTRPDTAGKAALVAFYTSTRQAPSGKELREFLKSKLPAWMVPAHFQSLDKMPVTASQKLDHARLPAITVEVEHAAARKVAANTPLERKLVVLWEEILGVTGLGITDNFWEVGGDSLKAMRLIVRMKKEGFASFGLKDAFLCPTVEATAKFLAHRTEALVEAVEALEAVEHGIIELRSSTGAAARLLCLPYACGDASSFLELSKLLPEGVRIEAASYAHASPELALVPSIARLAKELAEEVFARDEQTPLIIFGYSFGAHVAIALSAELEARGRAPAGLILGAATPPSTRRELERVVKKSEEDLSEEEARAYFRRLKRESQAMLDYRFPARMPAVETLLLAGRDEEDREVRAATPAFAERFPRAHVETLPGGHMLLHTHPLLVSQRVAAFVRRVLLEEVRGSRATNEGARAVGARE